MSLFFKHNLWKSAVPAVVICLSVSAAIFAGIAALRPAYLREVSLSDSPDARQYVLLGRNLLLRGHFSRSNTPPYAPDMVRTPVYPLFAGGLDIAGGAEAIYLAQCLLHAGSCLLLFLIVNRYFGKLAALCASLLFATDLMLAISNFEAMTEPLFVFLSLASACYLLPGLQPGPAAHTWPYRVCAGGLLLSLAILTRPAALYLPALYAGVFLLIGLRRGSLRLALLQAALVVSVTAVPLGAWVLRNYRIFSVARLTNVEVINLTYWVGGGAYQVEHGVGFEEAKEMISREYHVIPAVLAINDFRSGVPTSEIYTQLKETWPKVVFKYPRSLVVSSLTGILKAAVSHNVVKLTYFLGSEWVTPQTGALLQLRPDALRRLWQNGPLLTAVFGWETVHTLIMHAFAVVGLVLALKAPETRPIGVMLLLLVAYYELTVAAFGYDAYFRCRIPAVPFLDMVSGYGLARLGMMGIRCKKPSAQFLGTRAAAA